MASSDSCCRVVIAALLLTSACGGRGAKPAIVLFDGRGTSPGDVAAIESILNAHHLDYLTAGSWRLNFMTESQIREHHLLIVPGGNFVSIGKHLSPAATANIRSAVRNGMNYLGICAGAFFAGNSPYNGLNLTSGVRFPFYAAESRGIRKAPLAITMAAGSTLDQYWEDGPQLTGWGAVVAKYPDQTPAIVEGTFGNGWVVLSGVHPEAEAQWWRGMNFTAPLDADHAYAASLIEAALNRAPLPHF
ncbi:MAG TPA: BPL-N domain-containing protein [Bryobacteraceae bacterium]|nr:BPL-N domain-containing protein [Bryobacteraceae bacterium]